MKKVDFFLSYYKKRGCNFLLEKNNITNLDDKDKEIKASKSIENDEIIKMPICNLKTFEVLKDEVFNCTKCGLSKLRKNIVFGEGNISAELMFIGEGPGEEEDNTGRPFVGRAGKLLTKIIEAMNIKREDVYIANIIKCRPPGNRNPKEEEVKACYDYLINQIMLIKPKIIVTLGSPSTCTIFGREIKISKVRGLFYDWDHGIKIMPTFHPAYLLRNPKEKRLVWEDMQKVMSYLNLR